MANVLNEFLYGVSKGFQDAAFAAFSRRRSTVRSDINQSFTTDLPVGEGENAGESYLDLLNSSGTPEIEQALTVEKPEPAKRGRKKSTGMVDNSKKKKPRKSGGNKLSTI